MRPGTDGAAEVMLATVGREGGRVHRHASRIARGPRRATGEQVRRTAWAALLAVMLQAPAVASAYVASPALGAACSGGAATAALEPYGSGRSGAGSAPGMPLVLPGRNELASGAAAAVASGAQRVSSSSRLPSATPPSRLHQSGVLRGLRRAGRVGRVDSSRLRVVFLPNGGGAG
eukprot:scaffold2015_cov92-Isochrysis_galbana.AAC.7